MDVITWRCRVDHVCYYSDSLVISVQCDAGLSVFHQSTWVTLERNVSVRIVHLPVIIIFKPPPVAVFDVFCIPDFKITFAYCRPCRRRCTASARAWDHRQPAFPLSRIRAMKSLTIVVYTCDTVDSCSSVRYRDVAYSHAVGVYCVIAPPAICLRVFNLLYLQDIESIISMCCADLPGLSFSGCSRQRRYFPLIFFPYGIIHNKSPEAVS